MSPKFLMLYGALSGAVTCVAAATFGEGQFAFMLFAAGALFGKGYGVWEEREARPTTPAGGQDD